jgi:hypothetical protein
MSVLPVIRVILQMRVVRTQHSSVGSGPYFAILAAPGGGP